nr:Gfo/Idh/MocA family oxidoreductase [Novosphingobium sp. SG751A]
MWTRFLPAAQAFRDRLAGGAVGDVHMISGSFGTAKRIDPRNGAFDPARGGGAMAQLGTYPVSLAQWLFGPPVSIQASGRMGETGVDEDVAFTLRFANGVTGAFYASIRAWAPNDFQAMGPEGILAFHGPLYRPNGLRITRQAPQRFSEPKFHWKMRLKEHDAFHRIAQMMGWSARDRSKVENFRYTGNGYHYEADEVQQCVARGATESAIMPLDDSIAVARTLDAIRAALVTAPI